MYQLSIPRGVYLLKQSIRGSAFEHYSVGITGCHVPELEIFGPRVVHKRPDGIQVANWVPTAWTIIPTPAVDYAAALERLIRACQNPSYVLVGDNCEDFAREIVTGKKESRQVQGVAIGVAVCALLVFARD